MMLCVISWSMFSRLIDKKTLCTDERKRQLELTSPATEAKSVYFPSENAFFLISFPDAVPVSVQDQLTSYQTGSLTS